MGNSVELKVGDIVEHNENSFKVVEVHRKWVLFENSSSDRFFRSIYGVIGHIINGDYKLIPKKAENFNNLYEKLSNQD